MAPSSPTSRLSIIDLNLGLYTAAASARRARNEFRPAPRRGTWGIDPTPRATWRSGEERVPTGTSKGPATGGPLKRRRSESNRRMEVLQTSALPLGYGARALKLSPRPRHTQRDRRAQKADTPLADRPCRVLGKMVRRAEESGWSLLSLARVSTRTGFQTNSAGVEQVQE